MDKETQEKTDPMDTNILGKTLQQQRRSKGLTLKQVAGLSGVSISHLGRTERGERFPSGHILMKLAKPLGFTETELLKLAGFLFQDEGENRLDKFKKEIKLEITRALVRIYERIDSYEQ